MSGPGRTTPLALDEARRLAEQFLAATDELHDLVAGDHRETPRSFVFSVRTRAGEGLFGGGPVLVDKATGRVGPAPRGVWREFVDGEGALLRLQRWWGRRRWGY